MALKNVTIDVMHGDRFVGQVTLKTSSMFPLQDREVAEAVYTRYPYLRNERNVRFEFGERKPK